MKKRAYVFIIFFRIHLLAHGFSLSTAVYKGRCIVDIDRCAVSDRMADALQKH